MHKDSQWYQDRAQERREREAGRRSYQINRYRRDLEDLERLKRQLLREAAALKKFH